MKSLLLTFCFVGCLNAVLAQSNKFTLSLEYSPNISNITIKQFHFRDGTVGGFKFSNNLFFKGGYELLPRLYATAGIGLLETRELYKWGVGANYEVDKIESDYFHYYVVTPVGITYYFGSFFISPEIGIGWNINNHLKHHIYFSDGMVDIQKEDLDQNGMNITTYPVFLSTGYEIKMPSYSILMGIKGYYSLNPQVENYFETWHYYGIGVVTAVRF